MFVGIISNIFFRLLFWLGFSMFLLPYWIWMRFVWVSIASSWETLLDYTYERARWNMGEEETAYINSTDIEPEMFILCNQTEIKCLPLGKFRRMEWNGISLETHVMFTWQWSDLKGSIANSNGFAKISTADPRHFGGGVWITSLLLCSTVVQIHHARTHTCLRLRPMPIHTYLPPSPTRSLRLSRFLARSLDRHLSYLSQANHFILPILKLLSAAPFVRTVKSTADSSGPRDEPERSTK